MIRGRRDEDGGILPPPLYLRQPNSARFLPPFVLFFCALRLVLLVCGTDSSTILTSDRRSLVRSLEYQSVIDLRATKG